MKKNLLMLAATAALAAAAPQVAVAQKSAVTNAILNQRSNLLDKARADIDKAVEHPKTTDYAKAWYTRGEIYEQMMDSPIYSKGLTPGEGTRKAFESYTKAVALDGKDGEYGKQAATKMDNLYARAFNDAVNAYNAKEYDKAISSYQLASQVKPQDTTAVLYTAYAYEAKKDLAGAKESYNKLLGINGYQSPIVYNRLYQLAREEKNDAEASAVLKRALEAYPNNKEFLIQDLNVYLSTGRGTEAIDKLKRTIAADPTNSNLYSVLGSVYDQNKKPELALEAYRKATELDPKNFDAQYNLGVYNYNLGADASKKARMMDLKTYQTSGKKFEAEARKNFEAAIPYFEKALEVQPEDRNTLKSLQQAYLNSGRKADAERMSAKMEALK